MWKSSSHKLCTWIVSLLHGSSDGTSSLLIMRSSCHTSCTWIVSLHCHSFHESWCGKTPETSMVFPFMDPLMVLFCILILRSSCHTSCNWMAPLLCDSLHESSPDVEKLLSLLLHFNGCFLPGSSDGTSSLLIMKISCHTLCNWMASLQCNSLHES